MKKTKNKLKLFELNPEYQPDSKIDIVFVHGLHGNAIEYWKNDADDLWPKWLSRSISKSKIWSLNYEVESSARVGTSLSIQERAQTILTLLSHKIGNSPIFFITHSFGGLVIKQMLRLANDSKNNNNRKILNQTKGIVFIATPHIGSEVASLLNFYTVFSKYIYQNTITIEELNKNNPTLWGLHNWYTENHAGLGIINKVFYETEPTTYKGVTKMIVGRESAGFQFNEGLPALPLEGDHNSIIKPDDEDDLLYLEIIRFVEQTIKKKTD